MVQIAGKYWKLSLMRHVMAGNYIESCDAALEAHFGGKKPSSLFIASLRGRCPKVRERGKTSAWSETRSRSFWLSSLSTACHTGYFIAWMMNKTEWNLLYGCVSQGLRTTDDFTNLIGWNRYWPRSVFSHLDQSDFCGEKSVKLKLKIDPIHLWKCQKGWWGKKKKSKVDKQTSADFSSVHRRFCRLYAKCHLVQTTCIKRINFSLFVI